MQKLHARHFRPGFLEGNDCTRASPQGRSVGTARNIQVKMGAKGCVRRHCSRPCGLEPEQHSCARSMRTPTPPLLVPCPEPDRASLCARAGTRASSFFAERIKLVGSSCVTQGTQPRAL